MQEVEQRMELLPRNEPQHKHTYGENVGVPASPQPCISPGKLVSYQFTTEAERVCRQPESTDSDL
jgi:hypothetical protein